MDDRSQDEGRRCHDITHRALSLNILLENGVFMLVHILALKVRINLMRFDENQHFIAHQNLYIIDLLAYD